MHMLRGIFSCVYKYERNKKNKMKYNQAGILPLISHECILFAQPRLGVWMPRQYSLCMRDVMFISIVVLFLDLAEMCCI